MAKYDQGGGCACGLKAYCDCGQGQADGRSAKKALADEATACAKAQAERDRIPNAVKGLSPRARRLWERVKDPANYYPAYSPKTPLAMKELQDAGLVGTMGRRPIIRSYYVPVGAQPCREEEFPKDLP